MAVSPPAGAEYPAGTPRSREALALCHQAQAAPRGEKAALIGRALAMAEEAVAAEEGDALAHFAVFCAVGERTRLSGASLTSLLDARRLRREVDRTLELAPDFPGALLGKGALLCGLPRLLGGDAVEGERLVRRALAVDPEYFDARFRLARLLASQERYGEARAEARRALETAGRAQDAGDAAAARRLLAELGG